MPKLTSAGNSARSTAQPIRVVFVTMDTHVASATDRAVKDLRQVFPRLEVALHAATEWGDDGRSLARCKADIATGDIIIASMLFMEDHFRDIIEDLKARRDHCDAMVCLLSAAEVTKLTRIGRFRMDEPETGALAFLKKLRGSKGKAGSSASGGAHQMKMLRLLPQILRFIPGTAQDVRAYFLTLQYWLAGSEVNIANMIRMLIDRYADGPRKGLRGVGTAAPVIYPDTGLYHPRMKGRIGERPDLLPNTGRMGTVGLLVLRSYVLAGNSAHYDGVISALEARGLKVIPAFACGLDSRPAIERFFLDRNGRPVIDALISLTGFSLVGGPAYNDARAAEEILAKLDVPYLAAVPAELQTIEQWAGSERGLSPVESTIMVAIPELDGATGPIVFGGRSDHAGVACTGCTRACVFSANEGKRDMHPCPERADMLAARVGKLVALRRSERANRRVAIVLFNFPPNAGNTGTAAYLGVFESLLNTLTAMRSAGYTVEVPASVEALRTSIIEGNRDRYGATANVVARVSAEDHVRRERHLSEIESQWGPAPGRHQTDGSTIFVLGAQFGNVLVGVQPAFGYEGDPMRLLFEKGFAPTHAFSAFYRYLKEEFRAESVLHFGTHGALEFMPGKQVGLTASDWPDRLIGDLPNVYLYAGNNPSEGTIAKRRSAATLVSYMTPPIAHAGLYRGLLDLKSSLDHWRRIDVTANADAHETAALIQAQAAVVNLAEAEPVWGDEATQQIDRLTAAVLELEYTLIPHGLHVIGKPIEAAERAEMLIAIADAGHQLTLSPAAADAIVAGQKAQAVAAEAQLPADETHLKIIAELISANDQLARDHETPALLRALDGRYIRPVAGGDLLRTPEVMPSGRNIHGFDPFRIPSAFAMLDGGRQADRVLARAVADTGKLPQTVAMVLWGTDNLKNEGGPIAQVLSLIGARPRFDGYGRLAGAVLVPLAELGRPRIDVIITMSGIFRDLMPLQIKLLAEATYLAAAADEPVEQNFIRAHALAYQQEHGGDLETAALRVFGNADGTYGSNVNNLIESSAWSEEDEIAETYSRRKSFAYGRSGKPVQQRALMTSVLEKVDLAYQNLDSVELGVTTVDHYFDTLGGISRAVAKAKGGTSAPVYVGDQTRGAGVVRSLGEQVSLEARTRMLNPKWYEGMLAHGYEGVRQIEEHVSNTMGWSATTSEVAQWVYKGLSDTFILDPVMRARLAELNPTSAAKIVNRLIEATERNYWSPSEADLEALAKAGEELEDRLEGLTVHAAA